MSRCGCTTQCPACPQSEFVVNLFDPGNFFEMEVSGAVASVSQVLLAKTISIPAVAPGFGAVVTAEYTACSGGDQNDLTVQTSLFVDTTELSRRTKDFWEPSDCEGMPIIGGITPLAPGNRLFTLVIVASIGAGTGSLIFNGASMHIALIRVPNLTVEP